MFIFFAFLGPYYTCTFPLQPPSAVPQVSNCSLGLSHIISLESAAEATNCPPVFKSSPRLWNFTDKPGEMSQAVKITAPLSEQQEENVKVQKRKKKKLGKQREIY